MKKINKIIILVLSLAIAGVGFATWTVANKASIEKVCAFCNPEVLQTHTFFEDELVRGLCTHKPIQPGHCLVVVKRHIERFEQTSEEEITAIGTLLKKINTAVQTINGPSSYLLLQKNGAEVGQTVPHVHVHYIPKKTSDNKAAVFGLLWNLMIEPFKRPISQEMLSEWVGKMKTALNAQGSQEATLP